MEQHEAEKLGSGCPVAARRPDQSTHLGGQQIAAARRERAQIACGVEQERPADALQVSNLLRSCSLEEQWTEERASAWWQRHLPAGGSPPPPPEGADFHVDFGVVNPSVSAHP
jgi:hypothetical protein